MQAREPLDLVILPGNHLILTLASENQKKGEKSGCKICYLPLVETVLWETYNLIVFFIVTSFHFLSGLAFDKSGGRLGRSGG